MVSVMSPVMLYWSAAMRELATRLKNDEDGAALIEYTVLIGLMLAGVVATVALVGGFVSGQWTNLNSTL